MVLEQRSGVKSQWMSSVIWGKLLNCSDFLPVKQVLYKELNETLYVKGLPHHLAKSKTFIKGQLLLLPIKTELGAKIKCNLAARGTYWVKLLQWAVKVRRQQQVQGEREVRVLLLWTAGAIMGSPGGSQNEFLKAGRGHQKSLSLMKGPESPDGISLVRVLL